LITADDVRACRGPADVAALFRTLGYPVEPIELDAGEWKRGGIEIPGKMSLLARLERFDLFFSSEDLGDAAVARFLADYAAYNRCTESVLIKYIQERRLIEIHALDVRSARRAFISIDDPTSHGVDRLNLLALSSGDDPARLFSRALDRELVVRQFFARFRAAVRDLGRAFAESCPAEGTGAVADEALLIMSRLLFLCFVQEKGWLNGERRFLIDRADRCCESGADFFDAVLIPLFFGCLNTPARQREPTAQALGRIPYLNGGLFEPSAFERRNPAMRAPSELMRRIIEEVFEKFDFTIDETGGTGTRVDPEMLGKVFESLMAEEERAVSGSFYTPREIVDALTMRGIAEWTSGGDAALRDQLLTVMDGGEAAPSLKELAPDIVRRLENVTILDPACGSGAFLLSALSAIERLIVALSGEAPSDLRQRIVERSLHGVDLKPEAVRLCELRLWLAIVAGSEVGPENVRPLPNLDRNILQGNSLLSPLDFLGASRADIYRDWAWGIRAQKDLIERYRSAPKDERPALYRLVRANDRRLAGDLLQRAIDGDERELQLATTPRRDLFGDPVKEDLDYARTLRERLTLARRSLERVENAEVDFFSFDVHFAHVMAAGGFDLVVGNPPWVRCSRIEPAARRLYRQRYRLFGGGDAAFDLRPSPFGNAAVLEGRRPRTEGRMPAAAPHQPDLSVAFVERSVGLANPGGVISMLLPGKIVNAAYAAPLREFLTDGLTVTALIDWTDERRRYFRADTFPLGLIVKRDRDRGGTIDVTSGGESFSIAAADLSVNGRRSEWTLAPPDAAHILRRLRDRFPPFDEAIGRRPVMGVKTGDNQSFFLDAREVDCGWLTTVDGVAIPTEFICRAVRGRDVRRWLTRESHWMLWPPAAGWRQFPSWLLELAVKRGVEPDVLRLSYVRAEHVGIKVAWKDVARGMAATVLPESVEIAGHTFPLVPNQTLYSIDSVTMDEAFAVAGLLNSVAADALLVAVAECAKDDHYRYFGRTVATIPFPIPVAGSDLWQRLVRASRVAHREAKAPSDHDAVVAELYELTLGELEVLRAFAARRLAAR
jgi:hypothetical protein